MAVTVLDSVYTIEYSGAGDQNMLIDVKITRSNGALEGLPDLTIVDFIRDQLAAFTGTPVSIYKIERIKTTE